MTDLAKMKVDEFCQLYRENYFPKTEIKFLKGQCVETSAFIKDDNGEVVSEKVYYNYIEKYLDPSVYGSFIKWCTNYDYFSYHLNGEDWVIGAFIHFCWHSTKSYTILDIQGTKHSLKGGNKVYTFTDPAFISTIPGALGPTDQGARALNNFFLSHQCSELC